MKRNRLFPVALSLLAMSGFLACGKDYGTADDKPDAGTATDAEPVKDVVVGSDTSAPIDDASTADDADAGIIGDGGPCAACRSGLCESDGGCDPLVFTTALEYAGDFGAETGGIDAGDTACQSEQAGHFLAYLSTSSINALTRVTGTGGAERPLVMITGIRVADSIHSLFINGEPILPIDRTATGAAIPLGDTIWTGSNNFGGASGHVCMDWTTTLGGSVAAAGAFAPLTHWSFTGTDGACAAKRHLYCFEVVP